MASSPKSTIQVGNVSQEIGGNCIHESESSDISTNSTMRGPRDGIHTAGPAMATVLSPFPQPNLPVIKITSPDVSSMLLTNTAHLSTYEDIIPVTNREVYTIHDFKNGRVRRPTAEPCHDPFQHAAINEIITIGSSPLLFNSHRSAQSIKAGKCRIADCEYCAACALHSIDAFAEQEFATEKGEREQMDPYAHWEKNEWIPRLRIGGRSVGSTIESLNDPNKGLTKEPSKKNGVCWIKNCEYCMSAVSLIKRPESTRQAMQQIRTHLAVPDTAVMESWENGPSHGTNEVASPRSHEPYDYSIELCPEWHAKFGCRECRTVKLFMLDEFKHNAHHPALLPEEYRHNLVIVRNLVFMLSPLARKPEGLLANPPHFRIPDRSSDHNSQHAAQHDIQESSIQRDTNQERHSPGNCERLPESTIGVPFSSVNNEGIAETMKVSTQGTITTADGLDQQSNATSMARKKTSHRCHFPEDSDLPCRKRTEHDLSKPTNQRQHRGRGQVRDSLIAARSREPSPYPRSSQSSAVRRTESEYRRHSRTNILRPLRDTVPDLPSENSTIEGQKAGESSSLVTSKEAEIQQGTES